MSVEWAVPLWWVLVPGRDAISGNQFIERWYLAMTPPKPQKRAGIAEIAGWSGLLGARAWVISQYGARPAELARGGGARRREIGEPEHWNAVSRLYADHTDPLARFTGDFAATVESMRPDGLPAAEYGWVNPLKNRVPPMVRAVMAAPATGRYGGVIESAETVAAFRASTAQHAGHYEIVARRAYLTVLLDRLDQLRAADHPDPAVISILENTIAEYARRWGDPEQPPREPTAEEREIVHTALIAEVIAQPKLRERPELGAAYARATKLLLRRVVVDPGTVDGRILFSALRWVRIDAVRSRARISEREKHIPMELLPERYIAAPDATAAGAAARQVLDRAHAELCAYPEPDSPAGSWEKALALRVLEIGDHGGIAEYDTLGELVTAAWVRDARGPNARPEGACTTNPDTAARYAQSLLALVTARVTGRATQRYARQLQRVLDALATQRDTARRESTERAT